MNAITLTFLGSGSAFTVGEDNYQSNLLLHDVTHNQRLLIDCGSDIRFSLYEQNLSARDIDAVYISHVHADHVGGMEWLGFKRYFSALARPKLYASPDVTAILWSQALKGGMSSLADKTAALDDYFDLQSVQNQAFQWCGHTFSLVKTNHVLSNQHPQPCYGLLMTLNKTTVFFTADSRYDYERFKPHMAASDIIFHDCETSSTPSGVHAPYAKLATMPPAIKAKTWLYHYNPGPKADCLKDGFAGYISKGQTFTF